MFSHFITLATLLSNTTVQELKLKALSLNHPELELGVRDAKGKIETFKVYSHTLSAAKSVFTRAGKITLLAVDKNSPEKNNWKTYATASIPPDLSSIILILSGDEARPQITVVADPLEKTHGGSLRFFNTCPYPVGINLPGFKKILASGTETFCQPDLRPESYGQGQFFTSNLGGGWRPAGGIRWLHLNDIRTLWFIAPDPHNSNLVTLRGVEELVKSTLAAPNIKTNPKNFISQAE